MSNSLPISELISLRNLPVELFFLETSGSSLLNEIRYDDYKIGYSKDSNDGGSFFASIIIPEIDFVHGSKDSINKKLLRTFIYL